MEENIQKDFFISYHEQDRAWAEWIGWQLERKGYTCINPSWDFLAGSNSVRNMDEATRQTRCTLALLSPDYLGSPFAIAEWTAAFRQDPTGEQGKLLPIRVRECELSGLLASITFIDLVRGDEASAIERLLAGIRRTPIRPSVPPPYPGTASHLSSEAPVFPRKNILIASLGESPAVISAMYDLLTMQEKLAIDRLVVLCPDGDDVKRAYKLVQRALPELVREGRIECEEFRFKDASSFKDTCEFLKKLYMLLNRFQEKDDAVYLSLAGGRKSMSALMAWMVPFFSCVEQLYHVIDRDEQIGTRSHFFLSVNDIEDLSEDKFDYVMHPPAGKLKLMSIPFEQGLQLSQARRAELLAATVDDLAKKEYEDEQALLMVQAMVQPAEPLQVCVTEKVVRQFNDLRGWDEIAARSVKNGLLSMGEMTVLQRELFNDTEQETLRFQQDKSGKAKKLLHFFKGIDAAVRPVFYTEPSDISDYPDRPVGKVVVCALESAMMGRYRSLREIAHEDDFSLKGTLDLEHLIVSPASAESVLIVPLGKYPMVATQLYTLLKYREKRTIREVLLIYPGLASTIDHGARIIKNALWEEDQIPCKLISVIGEQKGQFDDIDSEEACIHFQRALEGAIDDVRGRYDPECKIDLALSGGRKGMTAMAIFAAQRKHISVVYHTVVADNNMSKKIESETTVTALQKAGRQKQSDRLFLREPEYCPSEEPYPYSNFSLFRVPVFSATTD